DPTGSKVKHVVAPAAAATAPTVADEDANKDGKRESKTRLTESTGKLIEEGRGNIGGDFTLQAREHARSS
ncbi:unnamed protein product, partial [Ectocarpus sp. 8 AP-2014]